MCDGKCEFKNSSKARFLLAVDLAAVHLERTNDILIENELERSKFINFFFQNFQNCFDTNET